MERLKDGRRTSAIATDVAARGLDVERSFVVVNYDVPMDSGSCVRVSVDTRTCGSRRSRAAVR